MTCTANFRYEEAGSVAFAADASKDGKGKGEGRQKKGQRDVDKPVRGNGPQEPRGELAAGQLQRQAWATPSPERRPRQPPQSEEATAASAMRPSTARPIIGTKPAASQVLLS